MRLEDTDWSTGFTGAHTHCQVLWPQAVEPRQVAPHGGGAELLHLLLQLLRHALLLLVLLSVGKLHHDGRGAALDTHTVIQFSSPLLEIQLGTNISSQNESEHIMYLCHLFVYLHGLGLVHGLNGRLGHLSSCERHKCTT